MSIYLNNIYFQRILSYAYFVLIDKLWKIWENLRIQYENDENIFQYNDF